MIFVPWFTSIRLSELHLLKGRISVDTMPMLPCPSYVHIHDSSDCKTECFGYFSNIVALHFETEDAVRNLISVDRIRVSLAFYMSSFVNFIVFVVSIRSPRKMAWVATSRVVTRMQAMRPLEGDRRDFIESIPVRSRHPSLFPISPVSGSICVREPFPAGFFTRLLHLIPKSVCHALSFLLLALNHKNRGRGIS